MVELSGFHRLHRIVSAESPDANLGFPFSTRNLGLDIEQTCWTAVVVKAHWTASANLSLIDRLQSSPPQEDTVGRVVPRDNAVAG